MSMTSTHTSAHEVANYGGFVDAFGGAATVVLAIVALSGTMPDILLGIATIVFGVALLIQSGTILSELSAVAASGSGQELGGGRLSTAFLGGAAGIVLGVLALIGINAVLLTSIAVIVFGSALAFGSSSISAVFRGRQIRFGGARAPTGAEMISDEIAAGSAGLQCLGGLAGIVLGILAVTGTHPAVLSLVALLAMGAMLLLTGATLSSVVQGFMWTGERRETFRSPAE